MKSPVENRPLRMHIFLLLLATLNDFFTLVAADCYWHDGSNAYDMQECYSQEGADGLCCAPGDLCLLNHLCQSNGMDRFLYRGACNMPNWTEAATCPEICVSERDGNNINLTDIQIVDSCIDEPGFFICDTGRESACADWNNPVFSMPGCLLEYNTAGNPMPVTNMPSCSNVNDPSLTSSTTFDIGPALTFTDHFVPTGSESQQPPSTQIASINSTESQLAPQKLPKHKVTELAN